MLLRYLTLFVLSCLCLKCCCLPRFCTNTSRAFAGRAFGRGSGRASAVKPMNVHRPARHEAETSRLMAQFGLVISGSLWSLKVTSHSQNVKGGCFLDVIKVFDVIRSFLLVFEVVLRPTLLHKYLARIRRQSIWTWFRPRKPGKSDECPPPRPA